MAKRQIRVSINKISDFIPYDEYLNFILSNSSVVLAKPVSMTLDILKVRNTRGRKMDLPLSQIAEIWAVEKVSS